MPSEEFLNINETGIGKPEITYLKEISEQKRKNKHENIKHFLAGIIIIPYIFLLLAGFILKLEVPTAYETISLIIIGYYFAKF